MNVVPEKSPFPFIVPILFVLVSITWMVTFLFGKGNALGRILFPIAIGLAVVLITIMYLQRHMPRKCPRCGRRMVKKEPRGADETYKYVCEECEITLDTHAMKRLI